jgi:hypothetical protein
VRPPVLVIVIVGVPLPRALAAAMTATKDPGAGVNTALVRAMALFVPEDAGDGVEASCAIVPAARISAAAYVPPLRAFVAP